MRRHSDTQYFPYTPCQLFELVSDVQKYPEFLPWVKAVRITERGDDWFIAQVVVRFKGITETYFSRVALTPHTAVDVTLVKGPFNHLENHWKFIPQDAGCKVEFYVAFEFRNALLDSVIGALFAKATEKMIAAFSERAKQLYA